MNKTTVAFFFAFGIISGYYIWKPTIQKHRHDTITTTKHEQQTKDISSNKS